MTPLVPFAAAGAALALWLAFRLARATRDRRLARAAYFDALRPLFDGGDLHLQPTGFPRLTGRRGGLAFDLQALPDSLTFRKLPALWVMVSLPQPLPIQATLDIMARPSGQEPFSHFANLPQSLPCPAFLPDGMAIRSDNAAAVPPESVIAAHAGLLADPRVKELLISPKGLRLVILAEEAERGRYLIFRDAEMGMTPLPPARVEPLLSALTALRDDLVDWSKGLG
ncbi:MAG: hypothetical protein IPL38_20475 [Rhodobacter sp.]|nr:hypothetical protein [Rhodobacter sp.]